MNIFFLSSFFADVFFIFALMVAFYASVSISFISSICVFVFYVALPFDGMAFIDCALIKPVCVSVCLWCVFFSPVPEI